MDRFDVIQFADLTGPEGGPWVKIGGGSFGVVYQGEYLGTPVAIKEVLPNNTYDVEKYFERECVLMKEARHPNIVQYIGLTKSPGPDGRIYIISEFVGGNVRSYIADKKREFPWRLRMSFAMDIARALAYLHARNCLHRDLKGENLLITPNERIKVCDFGFARIAARNQEEMRRISYCGTDGYMSPEILLGIDFSLPSDVFSLGVIFCEIASRHLVDSTTFKREMPSFGLDTEEIREMASEGCPEEFIRLCIDCVQVEADQRPQMREVVRRLRDIEMDLARREQQELQKGHTLKAVGSLRASSIKAVLGSRTAASKAKRPTVGPRLPSFEGKIRLSTQRNSEHTAASGEHSRQSSEDDEDIEAALAQLEGIKIDGKVLHSDLGASLKVSGHGNPWWSDYDGTGTLPTLPRSWLPIQEVEENRDIPEASPPRTKSVSPARETEYSTSVVRSSKHSPQGRKPSLADSRLTAPHTDDRGASSNVTVRARAGSSHIASSSISTPEPSDDHEDGPEAVPSWLTASSRISSRSMSGHHHEPSLAVATVASSIYSPAPLFHRFTLVKNGTWRPNSAAKLKAGEIPKDKDALSALGLSGSFLPPAVMLANALAKCHVCSRRIGWKPFLDCDDCTYKCHMACGDLAEPSCQEMHIPPGGRGSTVLSSVHAAGHGGGDDHRLPSLAEAGESKSAHFNQAQKPEAAVHVLRRAAAAAQASYAAEGGEAPPPPTKQSTLKQRSSDTAIASGDIRETDDLAPSVVPHAPSAGALPSRTKANKVLKRWSKGAPIRT